MSILKLNYIKYFLIFFLLIFFSCQLPIDKEIEKVEKLMWSSSDEYPTVPKCENFVDAKKRFSCLNDYLNKYLINNLKNNSHINDLKFNDSLKIKIIVDKNGKIYPNGIDFENSENDNEKIKSIIYEILDSIPNIIPAVKTDYGIKVKSKFILPIILNIEHEL
ncbi:MAG: hypothetical protein DBW74_02350 [Cryomorphaceae bacterium]|nr:MAG: hypothetical protein DBW74_02350 [Cryomorphaceae bacterium]|tara:strand:- start:322 stop:810 length:489 start_codon:yes stop_codon:yes gene_type:complete